MGVSGSGKTGVANGLAQRLGGAMLDGDYLHPRANILKMASGHALDDDDRAPWLRALSDAAFAMQRVNAVSFIVCSALKRKYRDLLREGNPNLRFIHLRGSFGLIESRMLARKGHYFKSQMLVTQFATLEEPGPDETDVIPVEINQTLEEVIADAMARITAAS